ncbi:MAG: short-chain dehydrogenase/reductase, partial [Mesorhizobium sp.]
PQLLLGSDALKLVSERIERLQQEIEAWRAVTISTDG